MKPTPKRKPENPPCPCGRPPWDGCPRCKPAPVWCEFLRERAGAPRPVHPSEVQRVKRILIENPQVFAPLVAGLLQDFQESEE